MAEISKFFNSAPGDARSYQASDFASYFGDVLSSGLLHTDNIPALEVKCEGTDLRTYVEPGKAIIQGYGYQNTANLYLEHALPEATLDRIDRIVLRLDKRNQSRFIKMFIVQGEASETPIPPALTRDDFIYELSLAQIRVRANTSTLNPADLIDERLDGDLCGLVYSLISIPTSQFQAEWDAFMEDIQAEGFASASEFAAHKAEDAIHVAGGTANTISISTGQNYAYTQHKRLSFKAVTDNTGDVTIDVDGKGAKPALKFDGTQLAAGSIKAGKVYDFYYDTANGGRFFLIAKASGNATAGDVLAGKTASGDDGEFTGSMPNNGAVTITPGATAQSIPAGYHNGLGIVQGDADLVPANIKQGVNLFGVVGNLPSYSSVAQLGDNKISSATTNRTVTNSTNTKVKEIEVTNLTGQVVVRWNIRSTSGAGIEGRLYHNSTEIDYALVSSSTYAVREKTISISPGDKIAVWLQYNGANCNELSLIGIFQPPAQSILMS